MINITLHDGKVKHNFLFPENFVELTEKQYIKAIAHLSTSDFSLVQVIKFFTEFADIPKHILVLVDDEQMLELIKLLSFIYEPYQAQKMHLTQYNGVILKPDYTWTTKDFILIMRQIELHTEDKSYNPVPKLMAILQPQCKREVYDMSFSYALIVNLQQFIFYVKSEYPNIWTKKVKQNIQEQETEDHIPDDTTDENDPDKYGWFSRLVRIAKNENPFGKLEDIEKTYYETFLMWYEQEMIEQKLRLSKK